MTDWRICPWCDPDDNEWPASEFTASAGSWPEHRRPCNACFAQAYPKRRTRCTSCGARMETRARAKHPRCLRCREASRTAREIEMAREIESRRCPECGKPRVQRQYKGIACKDCRLARRRLEAERRRQESSSRRPIRLRKKKKPAPVRISFAGFRFSRRYEEAA